MPFHDILKRNGGDSFMARPKTYHIILSDNEVSALRKVIRDKKTCKTVLKRCQILLELDEVSGTGLTHSQIAHTYAVCPATVTNIIQSYVKNGITDIVKYNISPNSSAALRKADGRTEAHLIQIACGSGTRRTLQMDTPDGQSGFWKRKPVLNWKHQSAEKQSAGY